MLTGLHSFVPTETHRFMAGSRVLSYQVAGQGAPLILVHGLSGSGRWWQKNVPSLARRFRVYTLDLPGFGSSHASGVDWMRGRQFALDEAAQIMLRWLDAQQLNRVHLVGHSMGGYVSADLAARVPERVDRMVLVDAAAVPIRQPLARKALDLASAIRYTPPDFLPVLVRDSLRAGPSTLLGAIRDIMASDISHALDRIQADLMIVWGQNDALLPLSMGYELRQRLPRAQFQVIRGAGHNPMWDRPEVFNDLVTRFLRGADSGNEANSEKKLTANSAKDA